MFGGHGSIMIGGHGGLQPRVVALEGESVIQAAAIEVLERGAVGFSLLRVDPATLVVPTGSDFTLYPFTGALDNKEPPDTGIWEITGNGTIQGSNDVASRYIVGVSLDYHDDSSVNTLWHFAFVRGKDLHTVTPTFTVDRVTCPGRTNVAELAEPDGRAMTAQFRHPASGDLTEYGLMAMHDQPGNITLIPDNITITYTSIGPGTV
jgi:hypothetical protein